MLTIRDACRRPFATITIVMVANGRRQEEEVIIREMSSLTREQRDTHKVQTC